MADIKGGGPVTEEKIRLVAESFAREAKKIYGSKLHEIILYGSCVRGDFKEDSDIDLSVGIYLNKKVGSYVKKGEPIAMVYANDSQKGEDAAAQIQSAYGISAEKPAPSKMIKAVIQAF